ncbi:MAG: InlB B-repeat-containing protein, partial [Solobacterium sp.]|nr:InlB B-repeat-containing protein [Solobacterium sp.]
DEDQSVTLPQSVYKLHYDFTGWNTKQDGSGTHYEPGQVIDTVTDLVGYGNSITLYAELIPSNMRNYRVEHWQEGGDFGWYYRKETEYLKGDYTAPVTPAVKEYEGFRMPEAQTVTIAEDDSTVVKYYYDRCRYYVAFDGNGATSGQMKPMMMSFVNPAYLRMNVFQKKGAVFTGWNTEPDGSGTAYSNGQSINKLTDVDDEIITLYAQWQEIPNEELTPSNGVIYVTCKADETIVLPGLPDGTTYTIEEVDVPNGWTLQTTDHINGTIVANQTKQETVTNKYAAEGEIVLEAHKRMEDGSLSEGQFTFELLDSGHNVIDTKANGTTDTEPYIYDDEGNTMENPYAGTAPVVFDALTFTENDIGRTYTYYIRETAGDDAKVQYDGHEETIRVRVSDGGHGNLVTDVTYDGDGALFTNRMNPTSMVIRKTTVNSPDDNEEFTFTLDLKDPEGNALSGSYQARKYLQDYEVTEQMTDVTEYSHTSNIDDEGNAHGTYDEYLSENDIVTIDGADRLHVKVWFSTESTSYDWLAIYPAGITPTEDNYNEASISGGKLGNGRSSTRPVEESYIREYDVEGDTVQFFFRSDSSVNYYGYYAVITAEALRMVESGYEDMTVSSGDTFTLKDGEYIVIEGLPNGAAYTVTEAPKENWTLTDVSGDTGTLKSGERAEAAFTNTYEKQVDMTAVIKAEKKVTGGIINTDDHFEFELQTEGGIALQTKTVDETGGKTSSVTFDPIQYTQEDIGKTFTYYIEEKEGADENIIYDRTLYKVEVSVDETGTHVVYKTIAPSEDSEDGYAEVVVEGVPVFTNQKLGEEVTVTASKAWTNTDGSTTPPEGASVTFTLLADGEETDYSVTLDGTVDEEPEEAGGYEKEAWVAEFTGMPVSRIEEAGTEVLINYTVKETGTWQDYQPDKEEVSDGGTITNKKTAADCSVVLQARKKVVGGTIEAKDDFRFMLESEDGTVLQTKMADKTGTADSLITFDEIKYDADDTGRTYTYYIREVKGSDGNVVYDTRTYKVEVTISEEGAKTVYMDEKGTVINGLPQFENKKKTTPPEEPPKPTPTPTPPATTPNTGDDARTGLYMATAGISFILMILCLLALIRDRRQEKRS